MLNRALPLLSFILLLVLPGIAAAAPTRSNSDSGADICEQAAAIAASESGVPPDILGALTLTETGRRRNGVLRPWAWSVNAEGAGQWFDDPASALRFAEGRVLAGRPNMDIGCFQINYRWHGQHFRSVAEMFDPLANARYAARFVRENYQQSGDWRAAAGAFHSRTPQYANKYLARFDQLRAQFRQRGFAGMTGTAGTYNRFADQQDVTQGGLGDPTLLAQTRLVGATPGTGYDPMMAAGSDAVHDLADPLAIARGDALILDDPAALDALDRMVAASEPQQPRRARQRDRSMLLGAAPGTAAMGGGSLAALGEYRPILVSAGRPLIGSGSPLPGLPDAQNGPPASASSLWQVAMAADQAAASP